MWTMTQREWIARVLSIAGLSGASLLSACNRDDAQSGGPDLAIVAAPDLAAADAKPGSDLGQPDASPTVRRPFLVGSSLRVADLMERADWRDPIPPASIPKGPTRRALAAAWLKDGLEEHASVAAFARFAIYSLAVGAPEDVVVDAQRASLDEVRHARACFGLAARYGAAEAGPGRLDITGALAALDLAQLAALTGKEGCVGETLGALLGEAQAAAAQDPEVIEILRRIVRDERRHAELAWRFVKWAAREGGSSVRDAVTVAIEEAIAATRAAPVRSFEGDLALWHAHGRVTCAEARDLAERGIRDLVVPALAALRSEDRPRQGAAVTASLA
jgi:hypothetical protein